MDANWYSVNGECLLNMGSTNTGFTVCRNMYTCVQEFNSFANRMEHFQNNLDSGQCFCHRAAVLYKM